MIAKEMKKDLYIELGNAAGGEGQYQVAARFQQVKEFL
jgi:hypothetical protein